MWVAKVKLKIFIDERAFAAALDRAGYNSIYKNIYDKVFLSYIMKGYKVCVKGSDCFYPYISDSPFKFDGFNPVRDISKVYVCREPARFLCREIKVGEGI